MTGPSVHDRLLWVGTTSSHLGVAVIEPWTGSRRLYGSLLVVTVP